MRLDKMTPEGTKSGRNGEHQKRQKLKSRIFRTALKSILHFACICLHLSYIKIVGKRQKMRI